jgi:hypothetical protein
MELTSVAKRSKEEKKLFRFYGNHLTLPNVLSARGQAGVKLTTLDDVIWCAFTKLHRRGVIVYMIFKINTNIPNRKLHVGYQIPLCMSTFFWDGGVGEWARWNAGVTYCVLKRLIIGLFVQNMSKVPK